MKKKLSCFLALLMAILFLPIFTAYAETDSESDTKEITILFTHDTHDYFEPEESEIEGSIREHGGAARLAALVQENSDENTIYVDGGDFSMGTLLQACFAEEGSELRILGAAGCAVTTLGNHEFDQGPEDTAQMLISAAASGDPVPDLVVSNLDFSGELTKEQEALKEALEIYGAKTYVIREVGGVKVAFFGLMGNNAVEDAPTSGQNWTDYIEAAKETVAEIGDQADVIVCLSHCGTNSDGESGEDIDLLKQVSGIDVVISAHSHSTYHEAVMVGDSVLGSSGEYLAYLGKITLSVSSDGVNCTDYELIPVDESAPEDPAVQEKTEYFKEKVKEEYLKDEDVSYDQVICRSPFSFISLAEMYASRDEYPMGDLIADSYLYEAKANGITDIDVAVVGLGTIRGSFTEGDITVAQAFEICSLGVGKDGSTGHPLVACYITGRELKLLAELDASLGDLVPSINMSYAGLQVEQNSKRFYFDRVTGVYLVKEDGSREELEDDRLYKVCCNVYAANMLGMVNNLTKGILSITPKAADGTPVTDLYDWELLTEDGKEIKEWTAFLHYLMSFEQEDGVSVIPDRYLTAQDRKIDTKEGGLAVLKSPGASTVAVILVPALLILLLVLLIRRIRKHRKV